MDTSIRTYVLRGGRLTAAQREAIDRLWPLYGMDGPQPEDPRDLFDRRAPLVLDIGYGNGASLAHACVAQPELNFLGVEVHPPGVGSALRLINECRADNVRLYRGDARTLLNDHIPARALAGVRLFFPDPWPKQRHHKRRIVQSEFVRLVAARLAPGGLLHLATDWSPYARHMLDVLETEPALINVVAPYALSRRPPFRPVTRFERRGWTLGHVSHDLIYRRQ